MSAAVGINLTQWQQAMSAYSNIFASTALAILLCGSVQAQDQDASEGDDPAGSGGGVWSVHVRGAGFYTDNFFYQPASPRSASGWLINPQLGYLTQTERLNVKLDAAGEYGAFDTPGTADDYLDGNATLDSAFQATARNRMQLLLEGRHGHDPFGVDRTESAPPASTAELDQWNQSNIAARYRYGANLAPANVELGANSLRRHYVTNRAASQYLDYTLRAVDGALFYNFSPKTSALIDLSHSIYDFDYAFGSMDNRSGTLDRSRIGVRWLATAKTSGDIRVGYRNRTFDASQPAIRGADWDAKIQWRPLGVSELSIKTGRTEQASYLAGVSAIDLKFAAVGWEKPWTPSLKSQVNYLESRANFIGTGRRDTFHSGTLDLEYRLSGYASAVANATVSNRDSSFAGRDFDRFSSFVGVRIGR